MFRTVTSLSLNPQGILQFKVLPTLLGPKRGVKLFYVTSYLSWAAVSTTQRENLFFRQKIKSRFMPVTVLI